MDRILTAMLQAAFDAGRELGSYEHDNYLGCPLWANSYYGDDYFQEWLRRVDIELYARGDD